MEENKLSGQSQPFVTVVIPTFNHAEFLKEAVASVLAQSFKDWEAVIINNFSVDDTISVVMNFNDSRLRLVNFQNFGCIAASRNKGVSLARGEWIAFLDSDDLWHPDKLQKCFSERQDEVDIMSHREATMIQNKIISISPYYSERDAAYRNLLFRGNCFSPSATIVKKKLLLQVGVFSEEKAFITAEDYDLWLRLAKEKPKVFFIDNVLSYYRLHSGNTSGSVMQHMNAGLEVLETHYLKLKPRNMSDLVRLYYQKSKIIYGAGRSFQKIDDENAARTYFIRALKIFPLNIYAVAGLLISARPSFKSIFKRNRNKCLKSIMPFVLIFSYKLRWLYVWTSIVIVLYFLQFKVIVKTAFFGIFGLN